MKEFRISNTIYYCAALLLIFTTKVEAQERSMDYYNESLLPRLQQAANTIPGQKPFEIRYIKFAESHRTFAKTVENGSNAPYVQARTAYQVRYNDSSFVMVDSGMDKEVNSFFGDPESTPFFKDKNQQIGEALQQANLIFITHEHGDHIAGVLRNDHKEKIQPKTILTKQEVHTLTTNPQMPELKMTQQDADNFLVVDFPEILPVAPGIVMMKAPGHTPGEVMLYIQFENGKEYIITGDVSWSYKGINDQLQKPESQRKRIGENAGQIEFELEWLNKLPNSIQLIVNHDDIFQPQLVKKGVLKEGFILQ